MCVHIHACMQAYWIAVRGTSIGICAGLYVYIAQERVIMRPSIFIFHSHAC